MSSTLNYTYLRPYKAEMVKRLHEKEFNFRDDLNIETYENATILPLRKGKATNAYWGYGGVVDQSGNYIQLSKISGLVDCSYEYQEYDYIDEKVVYCGYFRHHWGEFIAYCLPRLFYALKKDDTIQSYVFFTNENCDYSVRGNYLTILKALDILDKVKIISKPVKFKTVVVPELSYDTSKKYYSNEYLEIFNAINKKAQINKPNTYDKIFLTRSGLTKSINMESGTEVIDDFFKKNGFFVISPEKIPLYELIYYMDQAEIIACFSGTLPHNLLFCKNQCKDKNVIIIERNALFNFFQPETDTLLNAHITFIDANVSLYPVELSYGPFIYAFNQNLNQYAKDNNLVAPDDKYLTEKYKRYQFKKYIEAYKREHGLCLYMPDWMVEYSKQIFEAYHDGELYFWDYLKGKKHYKASQYFSLNSLKRIINRLLKR